MSRERTTTALERHADEWESLARLDPLWAILTTRSRKHNRWAVDEFFATGEREVAAVMTRVDALGYPIARDTLLDFGCGVGRMTRAFADRFTSCVGVDISPEMIDRARDLNAAVTGCVFQVNAAADLAVFASARFDMVYSGLVLQHLPDAPTIEGYVREMVRVLRPGGLLLFQLPCRIAAVRRLRPRRHAYRLLRRLGLSDDFLHHRLELTPMRETFVPIETVTRWLEDAGVELLAVERQSMDRRQESATYAATTRRRADSGWNPTSIAPARLSGP